MTKWLWYFGWIIGWFVVLWSFVFVPVSNLFLEGGAVYGAIRGLILASGMGVLIYGFVFINRRLRTREQEVPGAAGSVGAVVSGGMSEREVAFLAAARESALGTRSVSQGDTPVPRPHLAPDAGVVASTHASAVVRPNFNHDVTTGVMKSAGNPLIRRAFAQAMKEVETKTYDTGLWAMALVECNGDERAARLAYMKARAADIAWSDAKATESAQQTKHTKGGNS